MTSPLILFLQEFVEAGLRHTNQHNSFTHSLTNMNLLTHILSVLLTDTFIVISFVEWVTYLAWIFAGNSLAWALKLTLNS